ncbi:hypothetical protein VNO78_31952 [Psophocarpus tetragonolobus]|uniref:Uncharacterized protein n=1 Tax=Psophocarpus tetragonolobus TaxID=3891 RepID=A0AAN9RZ25_PSOTE
MCTKPSLVFPLFYLTPLCGSKMVFLSSAVSMAQSLEGIKGGGGSIKLGTTGTIGSLMTRELDHISSAPKKQVFSTRSKTQTLPVSVPCGNSTTQKRLQPRKSSVEASSSGSSKNANRRGPGNGISQKTKTNGRNTQRIPMLGSDKCSVDRTPKRLGLHP